MSESEIDTTVVYYLQNGAHTICGDPISNICMHSCAKPIQILPLIERGINNKYDLTLDEIAFMVSSHLGQDEHMAVFSSILRKTGLKENDLILPETSPCGRIANEIWRTKNGKVSKRYHPCSGNHLALMLIQRELTGSVVGYESPHSKSQLEIKDTLSEISKMDKVDILSTIDYCGVPAFVLPMYKIPYIYQRLAILAENNASIRTIIEAMHNFPRLVEGDGCISTVLNSYPNIIAKTGVNGIVAVSLLQQRIGIAIKTDAGWKTVVNCLVRCLDKLNQLPPTLESELNKCFFV